jgi:hypothetical protein
MMNLAGRKNFQGGPRVGTSGVMCANTFSVLISFSPFFFKAGFGMPPSQQPTPGAYPPPHEATAQLSYPLSPGFAGQVNPLTMSQYPSYPSSDTSMYPPSPGYPPANQTPLYPPTNLGTHPSPVYQQSMHSSSHCLPSQYSFPTPAPVSYASQPQPHNPVSPAYASPIGACPTSMIQGGYSLNRGPSVMHTIRSTYTKVSMSY